MVLCVCFVCRQADLQRMDILINGEAVDALARVVHRDKAQNVGRRLVAKLKVWRCPFFGGVGHPRKPRGWLAGGRSVRQRRAST